MKSFIAFFLILSTFTRFFFPDLRILLSVSRLPSSTSLSVSPYVPVTLSSLFYVACRLVVSAVHWSNTCLAVSSRVPQCLQMLVFARCLVALSPRRLLEPDLSLNMCLIASLFLGFIVI